MDLESPAPAQAPPAFPAIELPSLPLRPTAAERVVALFEVILCSDYPTQLLLVQLLTALGFAPMNAAGSLQLGFVVALSLGDTLLLLALILIFLKLRGDRPREVFFGSRAIWPEVRLGAPMTVVALLIAVVVMGTIQLLAPYLRTVPQNPLQDLVTTRADALVFALVVVIAGGVREELQRAFLMNRFERWLGGPAVGVVIASLAFGLGHAVQGFDAVIATSLLGAFWALVYLRRRSVIAPVVSHSGFNLLQLVQLIVAGR
jgi:membrane protease YdiL (CAAX protease family)